MQRDLTELNKLEDYLREHADEYGIKVSRYDNEDEYEGSEWAAMFSGPVDRHILTVWYKDKPIKSVEDLFWFNVSCSYCGFGADKGLLELHGALVQDNENLHTMPDINEEGFLTADEIIRRVEAVV